MIRLSTRYLPARYLLACLLAAFTTVHCLPQSTAAPQATTEQSLEDLGDSLLDDAMLQQLIDHAKSENTKPTGNAPAEGAPSLLPDVDALRRMLEPKGQLPRAGEDVGQAGESPLARISGRMAIAGDLISSQSTTGQTRAVQDEIVSELDKLIDKLNKQCQKCSGGQCNKPGSQQTQSSTPKPGGGKPSASAGKQAGQESQLSSGGGGEAQPGDATDREVVKQLWGQLPERLRQQLLQSTADEFLPKYREEIELYFRRLAEEQSNGTAN